jgi:hypothetical protein
MIPDDPKISEVAIRSVAHHEKKFQKTRTSQYAGAQTFTLRPFKIIGVTS